MPYFCGEKLEVCDVHVKERLAPGNKMVCLICGQLGEYFREELFLSQKREEDFE